MGKLALFRTRWQGLLALACVVFADPAWAQSPPCTAASPEQLRAQGDAAGRKGRHREAFQAYRALWDQTPSAPLACNIGRAALFSADFVPAAEWLGRCVRMVNDEISPEVIDLRRDEMSDFDLARKEVAELILEVEPGAQITLDKSRVVGVAPLVEPIYVLPGPHIIEARMGDGAVVITHIAVRGREHNVKLTLTQPVVSLSPPISPASAGEHAAKTWWPVALGGGATVAAIGTGIALHVASNSAASDYRITMDRLKADQYQRDPLGPRGCGQLAFHPDCETARDHDDRRIAFGNASTALFIVSGAISLMTVGFLAYEEYRVSIRPSVGGMAGSVVW